MTNGIKRNTKIVPHNYCVMKNVTVTLEENVAKWARIRAAELEITSPFAIPPVDLTR